MAEEVTHLIIKVSSDQAATAKQRLDSLGFSAQKAEKATDGMTGAASGLGGALARLIGPAAILAGIVAGLAKTLSVSRQFETLNAQLKTATGSAANAAEAFDALRQFATETPYDLAQTVEAFIQLTNRGLTPSERALRSYGNTASAMGKDLKDLVLAVSNSTTGEFETLKQFGIKARTEAEGIRFIFRGVGTLVRNDAKSIEEYFIKLGESNFASSMTEKMKTLDGAISNLSDAWDVLFDTIGKAGAADLMRRAIQGAIEVVQELTDMIASGELQGYIDALFYKFAGFGEAVGKVFELATDVVNSAFKWWTGEGKSTADFLTKAFTQFPENVTAAMKLVGASIGAIYEIAKATAIAFTNVWLASFQLVADVAIATGKLVATAINPLKAADAAKTFGTETSKAFQKFGNVAVGETKRVTDAVENVGQAWEESVVATLNERDAALGSFDAQIAKAKQLRAEYDALQTTKANAAKGGDRLAKFKVGGDDRVVSEGERQRFESLKKLLQLEEVSIRESYEKRLALIRDNTQEGSDIRLELEKQLNFQVTDEYEKAFQQRSTKVLGLETELRKAIAEGRTAEASILREQLQREQDDIAASYEERKNIILENTQLTEDERLALLVALEQRYTQQQVKFEVERQKAVLSTTADFFGNISKIAGAFGKKGAKIAQAAAIVQTTIKTYESATSAYAALAGIPYVGPALGAAAAGAAIAAGFANVAAIKSQNFAGEYAEGGIIPAGKVGLVGETGKPELVRGPAVVTGVDDTAKLLAGGGGGKVTLIVNNMVGGSEATATERDSPDGKIIELTIKRTKAELTSELNRGGGQFSRALEANYGLTRGKSSAA